jgi:hypothetical protein
MSAFKVLIGMSVQGLGPTLHWRPASSLKPQKKAYKTFTALPDDLGALDRNTRTFLIRMAMSCVHTQIQNVALPESELKAASVVRYDMPSALSCLITAPVTAKPIASNSSPRDCLS